MPVAASTGAALSLPRYARARKIWTARRSSVAGADEARQIDQCGIEMRDRAVEHLPVRQRRTIFDDAVYHSAQRRSVAEILRQVCLHEPQDEIHLPDINRLARQELAKLRDR